MTAPGVSDGVIVVDGLRMRYGTVEVLRDVTFRACRGEVLALLGPNGAGKTTTIEILEGFRRRSAGQANRKLRLLSGGQRRRLDLAVGLAGRPELLFLDEPTAGLDPQARREFHLLVARIAHDLATTILLTTHDLDEADKLADRIVILAGGRIIADGTAAQLADEIAGEDLVRWVCAGRRFAQSTPNSTRFVRELFASHGEAIAELEVRRASLEDTYLTLVRQGEATVDDGAADLAGAA